ncbi:9647_t:CDS:1, partial [Acaulospora morrowiae]
MAVRQAPRLYNLASTFNASNLSRKNNYYGFSRLLSTIRQAGSVGLNKKFLIPSITRNERNFQFSASTLNSSAENSSEKKPESKAKTLVKSFLHGSDSVKDLENQTHSKLVARGKYVHELQ